MKKLITLAMILVGISSHAINLNEISGSYQGNQGSYTCGVELVESQKDSNVLILKIIDANGKASSKTKIKKDRFDKIKKLSDYEFNIVAKKGLFPGYNHIVNFQLNNDGQLSDLTISLGERLFFGDHFIILGQNSCSNLSRK